MKTSKQKPNNLIIFLLKSHEFNIELGSLAVEKHNHRFKSTNETKEKEKNYKISKIYNEQMKVTHGK